jgi:hypothetical protein
MVDEQPNKEYIRRCLCKIRITVRIIGFSGDFSNSQRLIYKLENGKTSRSV